jgi:hypothetical protein
MVECLENVPAEDEAYPRMANHLGKACIDER